MFEIDKEKFGTFLSQLRKEKGLMQKELAEKLYVSDKAVSKWERGLSIPDVALLVPLSEILGVTVTELLECKRFPQDCSVEQTEQVVKKVISMTEERKYRPDRRKRGLQLLCSSVLGCLEIIGFMALGPLTDYFPQILVTLMLLMGGFGIYFCIFARERLPRYYDENRISSLSDGALRINIPGIYYNNNNWSHIVRVGQLWSTIGLALSPALFFILTWLHPFSAFLLLFFALLGLFIPLIIVAKKYES